MLYQAVRCASDLYWAGERCASDLYWAGERCASDLYRAGERCASDLYRAGERCASDLYRAGVRGNRHLPDNDLARAEAAHAEERRKPAEIRLSHARVSAAAGGGGKEWRVQAQTAVNGRSSRPPPART